MKCEDCKKEFKDGDKYFEDPIFHSPMCISHMDEMVETLKDVEDYSSLAKLQDGDCPELTFAKGVENE